MIENKRKYVYGFVVVIEKDKVDEYLEMAKVAWEIWMKHGALSYNECIGDDLNPDTQWNEILGFPKLVNLKPSQTVWFSYIEYKSKEHRDEVNKKVLEDPAMKSDSNSCAEDMPFDPKNNMSFWGFKSEIFYS